MEEFLTHLCLLADLDMGVGAVVTVTHPFQEVHAYWHFILGGFVREWTRTICLLTGASQELRANSHLLWVMDVRALVPSMASSVAVVELTVWLALQVLVASLDLALYGPTQDTISDPLRTGHLHCTLPLVHPVRTGSPYTREGALLPSCI